jgi:hypothetical protein
MQQHVVYLQTVPPTASLSSTSSMATTVMCNRSNISPGNLGQYYPIRHARGASVATSSSYQPIHPYWHYPPSQRQPVPPPAPTTWPVAPLPLRQPPRVHLNVIGGSSMDPTCFSHPPQDAAVSMSTAPPPLCPAQPVDSCACCFYNQGTHLMAQRLLQRYCAEERVLLEREQVQAQLVQLHHLVRIQLEQLQLQLELLRPRVPKISASTSDVSAAEVPSPPTSDASTSQDTSDGASSIRGASIRAAAT